MDSHDGQKDGLVVVIEGDRPVTVQRQQKRCWFCFFHQATLLSESLQGLGEGEGCERDELLLPLTGARASLLLMTACYSWNLLLPRNFLGGYQHDD